MTPPPLLDRLHRRGRLTWDMAEIGARFHRVYRQDPQGLDIRKAIDLMGGRDTPMSRVVLIVAGQGRTVAAAARAVAVPPEVATGLLLAGLGVLAGARKERARGRRAA